MSAKSGLHYSWVILFIGTLVVFGALGLARFGYSIVLPSMQSGLGLDNTQAGVLASANLVGYLVLSILGGALAARYGPRAVITVGLSLVGIGMLVTGTVQGFLPAAFWRGVTGIGSGASNVPVMGLLAAWFATRRRGLAAGIAVGGSSIALIVLGPLVPRILTYYGDVGWRMSWYLFGSATIILAILSWILLRNRPEEKGFHQFGSSGPSTSQKVQLSKALEWGRVYRAPAVWQLGFVYVAFGFSYIIYMTFFVKSLMTEGGYTPESAGNLFMLIGWVSLLSGLIWGSISDTIGRKKALVIVYLIQMISYAMFALWRTPASFTISSLLFGLTAWSIPAIMAATCGDVLGPRLAPAALGFITLFFGIGQAVGPSIAGAMADATGSFYSAYLLAAGVALVGAVGASMLKPASTAVSLESNV